MNQTAYRSLASCYDLLNDGVDYATWASYMETCFARYSERPVRRVLDLACGTGNMMLELLRRGYHVSGIDLSSEMLAEARRKANEEDYFPLFLCQDMCEFEMFAGSRAEAGSELDAVVCCLDSINYLTESGSLAKCFSRVRAHLRDGGLFLFDINTPYQFTHVYADNAYVLENEGILCAWQNTYRPATRRCRFDLSIFRECADGRYERTDEVQYERCYALKTVENTLQSCGFALCSSTSDFDGTPVTEQSCRAYYVARAI